MKVYLFKVEPEKYPDFKRRIARAVTRGALDDRIQYTSIRGFGTKKNGKEETREGVPPWCAGKTMIDFKKAVDMEIGHFGLGKVLWPVYGTLFADNFKELVDYCAEKGLYLYDFWGFVPGSNGVTDMWSEYTIPEEVDAYLQEKLGDHFLGYDNGEQDGRYVAAMAASAMPYPADRKTQYKNFQKYFEYLNRSMRDHTVTLASLTFLHYFAKEGNTIMLGAETAQALPSNPMWFSFIRGASRQYGLLTYGNASIWNRWGVKSADTTHEESRDMGGYLGGMYEGTSLSLLRRLLYNQYMYNCGILGFENGYLVSHKLQEGETPLEGDYVDGQTVTRLSHIGEILKHCMDFTDAHPDPGTLYTPFAVMTDFYAGWVPPRHLYTANVYRTWGNIPYGEADYELDAVFSLLYPGYENSGFYHDERGFMTPTPFGEICDVLLSDARQEILMQYDTLLLLSNVKLTHELYDKLKAFVENGGHAILTAACALTAPEKDGFLPVPGTAFSKSESRGKGTVTVLGQALLERKEGMAISRNAPDEDICHPYALTSGSRQYLSEVFRGMKIVYADNPLLQYTLCVRNDREFTLFVSNNTLRAENFSIVSALSKIESVTELEISDGTDRYKEYLPHIREDKAGKTENPGPYTVGPYDCRMFSVRTTPAGFVALGESLPVFEGKDLYLSAGDPGIGLKEFLLYNPTLLDRFEGLMVSGEYFDRISGEYAEAEGRYFRTRRIPVLCDLNPLLNHVPDIQMIGNFPKKDADSRKRIRSIIEKAEKYGARGILLGMTRNAENEWETEKAIESCLRILKEVGEICREKNMELYGVNRENLTDFECQVRYYTSGEYGKFAFDTALGCGHGDYDLEGAGLLLLSAAGADLFGQPYYSRNPIRGSAEENRLKETFRAAREKGIPVVLAAGYRDFDEAYVDLKFLTE